MHGPTHGAHEVTAISSITPPTSAEPDLRASLRLVGWLAASWVLLLIIGFFVLRTPGALAANNRVSVARSVFMSANVASLAGFASDFARPDDFSTPVRAIFVLQTLSGILLSLVGGGVLLARLLDRPYTDGQITATALGMMTFALLVGVAAGQGDAPLASAFQGLSALGCAGVLFGNMPRIGLPVSLTVVPLALIGSIGVVVVRDIINAVRSRQRLPEFSWRVLTLTAGLYLVGMVAMLIADLPDRVDWPARLVEHDALFWSARAWGAPIFFASAWPGELFWPVLAVMLIGAGSAGAAGSIGLGWLITAPPRLRHTITNALTAQAVLAAACIAALALVEPTLPPVRRVLLIASAVMNLGLSHEPLNQTGLSLFVLALCLVLAKLLPLGVFGVALRARLQTPKEST